jgi:hypothetical protein
VTPALSVIYYSNNRVPAALQRFCLAKLRAAVPGELICIVRPGAASHRALYRQILEGLSTATGRIVALAEHDVLYPAGYFEALIDAAPAGIVYNTNVYRLNRYGYFRSDNPHLLSNCGAPRPALRRAIRQKLAEGEIPEFAEPDPDAEFRSPHPTIDIRHSQNFTGPRRPDNRHYQKSITYWGPHTQYSRLLS